MNSENYRNTLIALMTALAITGADVEASARVNSITYPVDKPAVIRQIDDLKIVPISDSITYLSQDYSGYNYYDNHHDNHFEATVYNDYGLAADGTPVYSGMIAADPNVLPVGTKVYVEFSGAYSFMNGTYTVHDTGGAVVGNIVDIWVPWSYGEMIDFGRRSVTVTVLA